MGSVAASGGYYIACGGSKIIANPGTLTGSLGVILSAYNFVDVYAFLKIKQVVIKSGKFKDIGSNSREMTQEEKDLLQELLDNTHMQFKKVISKARNIPLEKLEDIADGRIFSGEQAYKKGLVDKLGGIQEATDEAVILSGMKDKPKLIYPKKENAFLSLIDKWLHGMSSESSKLMFLYRG
jgi:protease-4